MQSHSPYPDAEPSNSECKSEPPKSGSPHTRSSSTHAYIVGLSARLSPDSFAPDCSTRAPHSVYTSRDDVFNPPDHHRDFSTCPNGPVCLDPPRRGFSYIYARACTRLRASSRLALPPISLARKSRSLACFLDCLSSRDPGELNGTSDMLMTYVIC